MSPQFSNNYSKFGADLADALEQVAGDQELIDNPDAALEVLGITLPEGVEPAMPMDPEGLLKAAAAIRNGAIPGFWPWIWWIPWVDFAPPEGGGGS